MAFQLDEGMMSGILEARMNRSRYMQTVRLVDDPELGTP